MCWNKVYFDLDNTLFDHEEAFKRVVMFLAEKVPVPTKEWFNTFKHNSDKFWDFYEKGNVSKQDYRRLRFKATMNEFQLPTDDETADLFHHQYDELVPDFISFFKGVESLLNQLVKANVEIGIITNGKTNQQYRKIKKLQLLRWITPNHIFISEEHGTKKPNRKLFDLARNDEKSQPLFIGDSWDLDIVGAIEADWDALFFNSRDEQPKTDHQPVNICHTFGEVSEFLK